MSESENGRSPSGRAVMNEAAEGASSPFGLRSLTQPIYQDQNDAMEVAASFKEGEAENGILEEKIFLRLRCAYWRGYRDGARHQG